MTYLVLRSEDLSSPYLSNSILQIPPETPQNIPVQKTSTPPTHQSRKPDPLFNNSQSQLNGAVTVNAQHTFASSLPDRQFNNILATKNGSFAFAYNIASAKSPDFSWYMLPTEARTTASGLASAQQNKPVQLTTPSDRLAQLLNIAFSPDGTSMIETRDSGEIVITTISIGAHRSLGTYTIEAGHSKQARYEFPAYTPDGLNIVVHDPWENKLVVVPSDAKTLESGTIYKGFWVRPRAGEGFPAPNATVVLYTFSSDGSTVTFDSHQQLHLKKQ